MQAPPRSPKRSAIAEVPNGGHFFGSDHTLARYRTAFYQPLVSNWQNYPAIAEALFAFVARRKKNSATWIIEAR